jgi:hypothetical protein
MTVDKVVKLFNNVSDQDLDWILDSIRSGSISGSGSRRAKMTHKNRKKLRNFMF